MECDLQHFIQRQLYFLGCYEPEQVSLWMKLARQAEVIFDVGANVGVYALAAAAANPAATVHAFEPTPELAARLGVNIGLNQFERITVNATAVGQQSGEIYLHFSGGKDGTNEGMNYVSPTARHSSDQLVPLVSLDDYCQRQGIERVDLIKVDIEGAEYHALRGAEKLLRNQAVHCIFMELCGWAAERSGHTIADIVTFLGDLGYCFCEIHNSRLIKIDDRHLLTDRDVVILPTGRYEALNRFLA